MSEEAEWIVDEWILHAADAVSTEAAACMHRRARASAHAYTHAHMHARACMHARLYIWGFYVVMALRSYGPI